YFHVYSIVQGDTDYLRKPDKGVLIAAGSPDVTLKAAELEEFGLSQAEFYYDQTEEAAVKDRCWHPDAGYKCGLTWDTYKWNVLWNLRWRARLRYLREPQPGDNGEGVDVNVLGAGFPSPDSAPVENETYVPQESLTLFSSPIAGGLINKVQSWRGAFTSILQQAANGG
ncbi:MAG TPA: hypothetical protein VLS89_19300, partial [Candidatus Nanopelagicales bacterium]|nr:hypothetical protein [Candidatus Nanopelagicales bacterium]